MKEKLFQFVWVVDFDRKFGFHKRLDRLVFEQRLDNFLKKFCSR